MHPPVRTTRSSKNPGVVDLPKPRCSPSDVAADKAESKKIAAANAEKKCERAAQVAQVESEMRIAQKEVAHPSGRGQKKRVKKTFSRPDLVEEVRLNFLSIALTHPDSPYFPKATSTELAPAAVQHPGSELKRSVEMLELSDELKHARPTKVARYAFVVMPPQFFCEADQRPRMTQLSQGTREVAANKPRGLADMRRHSPMVNMVIKDFDYRRVESETESDDEDVGDDLEYPGGLPVSLVSPLFLFVKLLLRRTSSYRSPSSQLPLLMSHPRAPGSLALECALSILTYVDRSRKNSYHSSLKRLVAPRRHGQTSTPACFKIS